MEKLLATCAFICQIICQNTFSHDIRVVSFWNLWVKCIAIKSRRLVTESARHDAPLPSHTFVVSFQLIVFLSNSLLTFTSTNTAVTSVKIMGRMGVNSETTVSAANARLIDFCYLVPFWKIRAFQGDCGRKSRPNVVLLIPSATYTIGHGQPLPVYLQKLGLKMSLKWL